jgi:aldehyde dehydrogenase (NAD+)
MMTTTIDEVLESLHTTAPAVIGGEEVRSGNLLEVIDPANGTIIATTLQSTAHDVDRAVRAARRAFASWRLTSIEERSRQLRAIAEGLRGRGEEFAILETLDCGKPLTQARTDVEVAARYFEFYANVIEGYYGSVFRLNSEVTVEIHREPIGVTGHITPWNYPIAMAARVVAPAISVGNCAVLKPSEDAPLTSIRLAQLALQTGLLPGVLNVVPGRGLEAGEALAGHPGIAHIGVIGSTETGRKVAHAAADNVVPSTLELGGKSPNILFADADIDTALASVTRGILQNAGQTCSAGSRLLVHRSIHAEFVEALAERFRRTRIGAGLDDPDLGPLVSQRQRRRVADIVDRGAADGRVVVDGRIQGNDGRGSFFGPTLVDGLAADSYLAQTEVFGPVLAVTEFDTLEEAIAIANGTDYGLVAGVWTSDVRTARRAARDIRAGQVFINAFGAGGGVEIPFGGTGKSGHGREKGVEALAAYTQAKSVVINGA